MYAEVTIMTVIRLDLNDKDMTDVNKAVECLKNYDFQGFRALSENSYEDEYPHCRHYLSPGETGGLPTISLYKDNTDDIWHNDKMKTVLPEKLYSIEDAKAFFDELIRNNEEFHPEDDAFDVYFTSSYVPDWQRERLNSLMFDLYAMEWPEGFDPCGYIIDRTKELRKED